MTLKQALLQGRRLLEQAGIPEPRLTAEVLLAHATQHDRVWVLAHAHEELTELWWIHYGRYLHQRLGGTPTQYITGVQEFYGRPFRVTPDVLIPRPETEHLIEAALALPATMILDIGTGSGCIAGTLALERPEARVFATDVSTAALAVARRNAPGVRLVQCDLGSAFASRSFDLVISNPPYVALADRESLEREVREHEPALALFGGEDGLQFYRRLIPEAARLLRPGGHVILEIGATQADAIRAMLETWRNVDIRTDLAGRPRVAVATST
jgi:release factor glutamine methyltransferase